MANKNTTNKDPELERCIVSQKIGRFVKQIGPMQCVIIHVIAIYVSIDKTNITLFRYNYLYDINAKGKRTLVEFLIHSSFSSQ